jgi:hypothetical protein
MLEPADLQRLIQSGLDSDDIEVTRTALAAANEAIGYRDGYIAGLMRRD